MNGSLLKRLTGTTIAFLWAVGLSVAVTAPAHSAQVVCRPDYAYAVEVDGEYPPDALFYRSDMRGKFFIDIPSLRNGLLMDLQAKKMFGISRNLMSDEDGVLRFQDPIPPDAPAYAFSIDGPVIRCQAEDKNLRVLPVLSRPPAVGEMTIEALITDRREYREAMKLYTPDTQAIQVVSSYGKPVDLEVYFGTWCSHCKKYVPRILRVLQDVDNRNIRLKLIAVPKEFGEDEGPWQGKDLRVVPTVILKKDGKEITRLSTAETATPEVELAGVLAVLP
jgi:thiol-disulfide isomerase/thioredoxin